MLVLKTFKWKVVTAYQKHISCLVLAISYLKLSAISKLEINKIAKFKARFSNHKKFFNHEKYQNDTQLSSELWNIKASKEEPVLVWKILEQCQPYNVNIKRYLLCLNEKPQIAIYRGNNLLNKRTEIISKSRLRNKYKLASYDSMD